MLLQKDLDQQFSGFNIADDDDDAVKAELTRKNKGNIKRGILSSEQKGTHSFFFYLVQWVCQQVIEKLSNREVNPFGNRLAVSTLFYFIFWRPHFVLY
jgi:hypothetical protein